jgi:hypothetical protein
MVFFRGMMNQQRSLPRSNQMPMRTGGNFGGAFALNPSLSGLSTITQPRNTNQVTQYGRPIYNKDGESYSEKTITEPINGKFYNIPTVGANGNILSKDQAIQSVIGQDGKIIDPISGTPLQGYADLNDAVGAAKNRSQSINTSPANNMSFAQGMIGNIMPEQDGAALAKQQLGEPTMITQNIDGQRVLSDDEQSTIDNAALQERLKGRYDAPGYTKGQKIAAIAGVLGDVFSAPGDRNKTATIMQTIEAQRAGDMKRQQARLADESHRSVVGSLIKNGVISKELAPAAMANPELLNTILELRAQDTSIGGSTDIEAKRVGIEKTREDIKSSVAKTVLEEKKFDRSNFDSTRDYEFAVLRETNRRSENRERLDNDRFKIEESVRQYGIDSALERAKFEADEKAKRAAALRESGKPKKYSQNAKDSALFANKANNAIQALNRIEMNTDYNVGYSGADKFAGKEIAQSYEQAKKEFITAVLRRESGAAIGKDEYKQYGQIYFPAANDSSLVIEQKRKSRELQLVSMINQSDGFYSDPDFAVDPYDASVVDTIIANYNGVEYTDPNDQNFILQNSIQ